MRSGKSSTPKAHDPDEQAMPQHVLIVDDEPSICALLREAAQSSGWTATTTDSPDQFKELLLEPHDVLVLDLMMPGTDGIELLRHIAAKDVTANIILISGVDRRILQSAHDLANELGLNVLGVLSKPFRIGSFLSLLSAQPVPVTPLPPRVRTIISDQDIKHATANKEWVVHYQPQVDFATKTIIAIEALVRWQHPEFGLIYPDSFIGQVETSGLIDELTSAVFEIALADLARWRSGGHRLNLAVNVSARTLVDLSWPDRLLKQVLDAGIAPECLILEVTESGLMQDFSTSLDILTRLRMKGFLLSIDDYGTGYSSMQQIMRVPANELKIDKSFVMNMRDHDNAQIIVDHTIQMAHKLRLKVVAEGVETTEAWGSLARAGCDIAQGYAISRPIPADKLTEFLASTTWRGKLLR